MRFAVVGHGRALPLIAFSSLFLQLPESTVGFAYEISGIPCHRVPLRQKDDNAPFCLAASSAMDLMNLKDLEGTPVNFLASQVWPSARVAAFALEKHMDPSLFATICEFGCGPGLPSLAAAKFGAQKVIATDLDPLALQLVERASKEQNLDHVVSTQRFDLTAKIDKDGGVFPEADLYLFSDVFESKHVATGAAEVSNFILQHSDTAKIWVFAQSDRACRDVFLTAMRKHLGNDIILQWKPLDQYQPTDACRLHLFDLDETLVSYG
jgi:predicted nicotinamide N-methyase